MRQWSISIILWNCRLALSPLTRVKIWTDWTPRFWDGLSYTLRERIWLGYVLRQNFTYYLPFCLWLATLHTLFWMGQAICFRRVISWTVELRTIQQITFIYTTIQEGIFSVWATNSLHDTFVQLNYNDFFTSYLSFSTFHFYIFFLSHLAITLILSFFCDTFRDNLCKRYINQNWNHLIIYLIYST